MKGDFTRLTFRPEKHYTSVRMQQGRLQLDSDWNEQADIQNYLYQVQVKDLIGEVNGVPTSEGSATQPYRDSFKLGVTPEVEGENNRIENDLTIAPGRLYANGTLCQLEATPFEFQVVSQSSNRVKVTTLIIDGRILEPEQWVEVYTDANNNELAPEDRQLLRIKKIDRDELALTLSNGITLKKGKMRRRLTYKTQLDYPKPELPQDGLYLAYLDVWQRHVTAIDDPYLREVALSNVPDTTTRTQTVWQLKLQKLDKTVIQPFVEELWDILQNLLAQIVINPENRSLQEQLNQSSQKVLQDVGNLESVEKDLLDNLKKLLKADLKRRFRWLVNTEPRDELNKILNQPNGSNINKKELQRTLRRSLNQGTPAEVEEQRKQVEAPFDGTQAQAFDSFLAKVTAAAAVEKRSEQRKQFRRLLHQRLTLQPGQEIDPGWQSELKQLLSSVSGSASAKDKLRQEFDQLTAFEQQLVEIKRLVAVSQSGVLESAEKTEPELPIQAIWRKYIASQQNRRPLMNARAKLGTGNGTGYRRVENQLYRVEIHDAGIVGDQTDGAASTPRATFKWSRDNGSVVSTIDKIQGNVITIRKSSQDAWANSKTGQWIEITNEELELKGKPGVMVPLIRAFDTKLEFNASRIVGGSLPERPTKVRRWDQQTDNATLLTRSADWIELESGIQVQFSQNSQYQTGDYWLLPARAATNDIEWVNDQAEENPKPLPQPPLGIEHDYCLLGAVQVKDDKFPQPKPKNENQEENQEEDKKTDGLKDYRIVFPPLVRCLDTAGGTVEGDLYIKGKVGIKTDEPKADLDVRGKIITQDLDVTGEFASNLFRGKTFQIAENPTADDFKVYGTIQAGDSDYPNHIVFNAIQQNTHFVFIGGKVEIGDGTLPTSVETLQINGTAQIQTNHGSVILGCTQANPTAPINALNLTSGTQSVNLGFQNNQCTFTSENLNAYAFDREVRANIGLTTSKLGIGYALPIPTAQLAVNGKVGIGTPAPNADLEVTGTTKLNGLAIGSATPLPNAGELRTNSSVLLAATNGSVTIGEAVQSDQKLQVKGSAQIQTNPGSITLGLIQSPEPTLVSFWNATSGGKSAEMGFRDNTWVMRTNGRDRLAIDLSSNKIGIGTAPATAELEVNGTVSATRFQGDGSGLTGVLTATGANTFSGKLTVNNELTTRDRTTLATGGGNVGIGTNAPASRLTVNDNVAIGQNYVQPNPTTAPENGLIVEGSAGIGIFPKRGAGQPSADLTAKLEVQGENNNANKAGLNVTDASRNSLFYVRNDGSVGIGTTTPNKKLDVNGAIECNRVFIAGSGSFGKDNNNDLILQDADVQIERDLFVQQKLHAAIVETDTISGVKVLKAREVQGGSFTQVSSRSLKEEINEISSEEVAQILSHLTPVKFNFLADENHTIHAGFIAEETPDLLTSADKKSIKVVDIVAILTKALQDQQKQAIDLTTIIENQQSELHLLQEKVRDLEEQSVMQHQLRASALPAMQSRSSPSLGDRIDHASTRSVIRGRRSLPTGWKRLLRRLFSWVRGVSR